MNDNMIHSATKYKIFNIIKLFLDVFKAFETFFERFLSFSQLSFVIKLLIFQLIFFEHSLLVVTFIC